MRKDNIADEMYRSVAVANTDSGQDKALKTWESDIVRQDHIAQSVLRKLDIIGPHNVHLLHADPYKVMAVFREDSRSFIISLGNYAIYSDSDGHMIVIETPIPERLHNLFNSQNGYGRNNNVRNIDIIVKELISVMRIFISELVDVDITDFSLGYLLFDLNDWLLYEELKYPRRYTDKSAREIVHELSTQRLLVAIEPGCIFYASAMSIAYLLHADEANRLSMRSPGTTSGIVVRNIIEGRFRPWPSTKAAPSIKTVIPNHRMAKDFDFTTRDDRLDTAVSYELFHEITSQSCAHVSDDDKKALLRDLCHSSFLYHRNANSARIIQGLYGFVVRCAPMIYFTCEAFGDNYFCWWSGREVPHRCQDIVSVLMTKLVLEATPYIGCSEVAADLLFSPDGTDSGLIIAPHIEQQEGCAAHSSRKAVRQILPSGVKLI